MGWPMVALGEVVRLDLDTITVDPTESYETVGVYSFGRGLFDRRPVLGSESSYKKFNRLGAEHFVLSLLFGWEGALSYVAERFVGKYVSPYFPTFRCDPKRLDVKYLDWFTKRSSVWEALKAQSSGLGDRRRTLKPDHLLNISIPLLPLNEQQRIVAKLDRVAGLVGEAMSLQTSVENDWKALLVNMAHRPDLSAAEKKDLGWREVKLKEILTEAAEPYDVDPETSYPNLGIYSFARGAFAKPSIDGASTSAKTLYRVRKSQFIYSRLFAFEGAYTIVPTELDGRFVSNEFPSFDIDAQAATPEFLAAFFMNPHVWTGLQAGSLGLGSRRQRVNQKHLVEHTIWLPPLAWQHRIGDVFGKFRSDIETEGLDIDALMPAVLHVVFSGATTFVLDVQPQS